MSFTEDCEIYLSNMNVDTDKLTNKEIRELFGEVTGEPVDW